MLRLQRVCTSVPKDMRILPFSCMRNYSQYKDNQFGCIAGYRNMQTIFEIDPYYQDTPEEDWPVIPCPDFNVFMKSKQNNGFNSGPQSIVNGRFVANWHIEYVPKKEQNSASQQEAIQLGSLRDIANNINRISEYATPSPIGINDQTVVNSKLRKSKEFDLNDFNIVYRHISPCWYDYKYEGYSYEFCSSNEKKLSMKQLFALETAAVEFKYDHDFEPGDVTKTVKDSLSKWNPSLTGNAFDVEFVPHKLIMYKKGDMFTVHKDAKHHPRQIGSCIVFLPSQFEGGELVIYDDNNNSCSIGSKQNELEMKKNDNCVSYECQYKSLSDFKESGNVLEYVIFHSDMKHEIKPVVTGTRLAMTFDICIVNYDTISYEMLLGTGPCDDDHDAHGHDDEYVEQIKQYIINYFNKCGKFNNCNTKDLNICVMMRHGYICDDLREYLLKGSDRKLYQVLKQAFGYANVSLTCLNTHGKFPYDYPDEFEGRDCSDFVTCSPIMLKLDEKTKEITNNSKHLNDYCHVLLLHGMGGIELAHSWRSDFVGNHAIGASYRYYNAGVVINMKNYLHAKYHNG